MATGTEQPLSPQKMIESARTTLSPDESPCEGANGQGKFQIFTSALERHGYSAKQGAWKCIAKDLGWSLEDVETYAYRYFIALQTSNGTDGVPTGSNGEEDTWTLEESTLFEALLVRHITLVNQQQEGVPQVNLSWEEKVAAWIPGKTVEDVRYRYETKYRQNEAATGEVQYM
mmetsp:Transcript_6461/g.10714  ORF Transcript_6461/g.10714 Transcript_6461/m.10714 type:complete len:173 (-) Transcript_6461:467-985(-)|eukprot:CAMPEP_0119009252 /NCGR_PEP_ID=MMETSP1176-20130426/4238_1 /TAXON_ID=265551 /ORGANISM="Synedropsis recta cf, Strain CCMP1620" /LENGTH=172 /DNA_ID=CAMNT_0006961725 /DNA_START=91 /DNA_END=609 /DNA_ORIENTATION=-